MDDHAAWKDFIKRSYINYLKTSFYFRDKALRDSFQEALGRQGELVKGPFSEPAYDFERGDSASELAARFFHGDADGLPPALLDGKLYAHQEAAVKSAFGDDKNIVVATGTASGKTECFLYPILFDLYRQHLDGELAEPGVRAMIIYPMNALANDQRQRLGALCRKLAAANSDFRFTFGQYTGQTPENIRDRFRNGQAKHDDRLPGEVVFREEMRAAPPNILLTNYSMLEYLLIRPHDSPLFERGRHWRFIALDEAHLHRGARGAEMGMLMRRLKRRVSEGGRVSPFTCIATSATITSSQTQSARGEVAEFATALFGEPFSADADSVIFGKTLPQANGGAPRRRHLFARALESAFLVHESGKDRVALNRTALGQDAAPIEIALCRDCGQHYYIGRESAGKLAEPIRDPSATGFGVTYFMPVDAAASADATHILCRRCANIASVASVKAGLACDCRASAAIPVKKCESDKANPDQIKACEFCGYTRGGYKDPVQEIVHGSDGPNAVFVTALHQLLSKDRRRVLSFADSRQEAAFFAWYAENSYGDIVDRNSILRALTDQPIDGEALSASDLADRLRNYWDSRPSKFTETDTAASKRTKAMKAVWSEALTEDKRISLMGVGLAKWFVHIPRDLEPPASMLRRPWSFSREEALDAIAYLLRLMAERRAVETPDLPGLNWDDISEGRPQMSYAADSVGSSKSARIWGNSQSAAVQFLTRAAGVDADEARDLMKEIWRALTQRDRGKRKDEKMLTRVGNTATFRLNPAFMRIAKPAPSEIWACGTCGGVSLVNIRGACPRWRCSGALRHADESALRENHYRILYESAALPLTFHAEEHTAQIDTDEAEDRQDAFKNGAINLLSSSTTFEVGVDLGELDVVFLRNVPPEAFNYTQRVGRAGRRDNTPGFALTYCRRSSHDLHYYENPEQNLINGGSRPPLARVENAKIILRHMTAAALGVFFKQDGNAARFKNVSEFIGDSDAERLGDELRDFCRNHAALRQALVAIVPPAAQPAVGLEDGSWIDKIAGEGSKLHDGIVGLLNDIRELQALEMQFALQRDYNGARRIQRRLDTILGERVLEFLSRKAILPKYGFPVDVVELDILGGRSGFAAQGIALQRDLSQAIAEYAPGNKIVADKLVWESSGIKIMPGKLPTSKYYRYCDDGLFEQWNEKPDGARGLRQYLTPDWGFATEMNYKPVEPQRKTERLYTTRPFFGGFAGGKEPAAREMRGAIVTAAAPGSLFILSEGRGKKGFHICLACGRHSEKRLPKHRTLYGAACEGRMGKYSYGYELVTDVARLSFPGLASSADAYSLGYALLLGGAETLGAPETDLNVALSRERASAGVSIVLYDNAPGGAGLVDRLARDDAVFGAALKNAARRVAGDCGCDSSCYGCLRSYRNQFVHERLDRARARGFLGDAGAG